MHPLYEYRMESTRMDENQREVIKGRVKEDKYQAFADYLSAYVRGYKEHFGIEIYAISPTNEPEVTVDYSSCYWDGEELHEFVRDHLIPTFDRDGVSAKLILGEHGSWSEEPALPSLNDPITASRIDIVGVHAYLTPRKPFPARFCQSGKAGNMQQAGQADLDDGSQRRWTKYHGNRGRPLLGKTPPHPPGRRRRQRLALLVGYQQHRRQKRTDLPQP